MSNKKRISRKLKQQSFDSLKKEFAKRLFLKDCEIVMLRAQMAIVQSQPRKPYPEGDWNPPVKNNRFLVVGDRGQEFISDRFGNGKEINVESSWTKFLLDKKDYEMPFLRYLENEIKRKSQTPGETQSGEAEKFLKINIRLQTDTNNKTA